MKYDKTDKKGKFEITKKTYFKVNDVLIKK